jgi:hypothetical protein
MLARYPLKNMYKEQDGFEVVFLCGGCAEDGFLEEAFEAHRLSSKKIIYMGRVNVTPAKVPKQIVEFKARKLGKIKLHSAQTVRLMMLSGHYVLGPEIVNNGECYISRSGVLFFLYAYFSPDSFHTHRGLFHYSVAVRELLHGGYNAFNASDYCLQVVSVQMLTSWRHMPRLARILKQEKWMFGWCIGCFSTSLRQIAREAARSTTCSGRSETVSLTSAPGRKP